MVRMVRVGMQQLAKLWSRRFMGSIPIVPEREKKKIEKQIANHC